MGFEEEPTQLHVQPDTDQGQQDKEPWLGAGAGVQPPHHTGLCAGSDVRTGHRFPRAAVAVPGLEVSKVRLENMG